MIEKETLKTKNPCLVNEYRRIFPYCEACLWLNGLANIQPFELHHIFGGIRRTDEIWNIINVCNWLNQNDHHGRGTTHNLKYGIESREWNEKYLAIKYLKGEISSERLIEKKCQEAVLKLAEGIKNSYNYRMMIRMGFIEGGISC